MRLLGEYRVEYVNIGEIERHYYPERGLDKFSPHPGRRVGVLQPHGGDIPSRVGFHAP